MGGEKVRRLGRVEKVTGLGGRLERRVKVKNEEKRAIIWIEIVPKEG